MIPRVAHPMHPHHLPLLDQELATHLPVVAALERLAALAQALVEGADDDGQQGGLDVFGSAAQVEGAGHAELGIELFRRVGVDGEGAGGRGGVEGDQRWVAAADDDEGGGHGQAGEVGRRDGGAEGAQVFLAVLEEGGVLVLEGLDG